MTEPLANRGVELVGIVAAVVAVDQFTKSLVTRSLGPGSGRDGVAVVGDLVTLEYARNTGIAFGFLAGAGAFLTMGVVVLTVAVAIHAWRGRRDVTGQRIAVALMLGGAIGNLIDRARLGYVVDFVSVGVWPTFNVADAAISTGVVIVAYTLFRSEPAPPAGLPVSLSDQGRQDLLSPARDRRTSVTDHG